MIYINRKQDIALTTSQIKKTVLSNHSRSTTKSLSTSRINQRSFNQRKNSKKHSTDQLSVFEIACFSFCCEGIAREMFDYYQESQHWRQMSALSMFYLQKKGCCREDVLQSPLSIMWRLFRLFYRFASVFAIFLSHHIFKFKFRSAHKAMDRCERFQ